MKTLLCVQMYMVGQDERRNHIHRHEHELSMMLYICEANMIIQ